MEHSDEEILIAHSVDSTTFIDEYLDTASLDSTNFSQESRDNLVFPNSSVILRHNKQSIIIWHHYDAGRFNKSLLVKVEEENGFAEFTEHAFSSPLHSNKVALVFVFDCLHMYKILLVGCNEYHSVSC